MFRIFLCGFVFLVYSCSFVNEGKSEICFVGDSITHIWDLEYSFPGFYIHKHAENGAKIQNLDNWNLNDCEGIPTVFLMGTNNIGRYLEDDEKFKQIHEDFLKELIPRLDKIKADPLLLISILPRNIKWNESEKVNVNIEMQNKIIKDSLDKMHYNYKYIDVFYLFLDEGYEVKKNYFYDGVHPSREGYEILSSKVLEYL